MIEVGDEVEGKWCPFEYEFLPEFCYTCGIIGHDDKACSIKLGRSEKQQFGRWLRAMIPKKSFSGDRRGWEERGSKTNRGFGFGSRSGGSGSESLSWRKDGVAKDGSKVLEKGVDVTNLAKTLVGYKGTVEDKTKRQRVIVAVEEGGVQKERSSVMVCS
jgi:hypothetical protein